MVDTAAPPGFRIPAWKNTSAMKTLLFHQKNTKSATTSLNILHTLPQCQFPSILSFFANKSGQKVRADSTALPGLNLHHVSMCTIKHSTDSLHAHLFATKIPVHPVESSLCLFDGYLRCRKTIESGISLHVSLKLNPKHVQVYCMTC